MKEVNKGILEIAFSAILFGLIPLVVKFSNLDSYSLSFGRILFATLFLFVWISFAKIKIKSIMKDKFLFFLFGLFHALIIIFYFISIKLINISIATLLLYSGSIYLVILSAIFLKEKIEKITILSIAIAFAGLFLIFFTDKLSLNLWGYLAALSSGILMSFVYLFGKILSKDYNKMSLTLLQNCIALPFTIPLLIYAKFDFTIYNFFTLIILGVFFTAIPFLLLFSGMKKIKGQKIGIILLLEIVIPILSGFLLFKEIPNLREILGVFLILIGFFLIIIFHKEK